MLRRLISTSLEEFWAPLSNENKTALKHELLFSIQNESDSGIRKKITDVIAELARFLIDQAGQNQWPEVLTFLFEMSQSTNYIMKECALNIFT